MIRSFAILALGLAAVLLYGSGCAVLSPPALTVQGDLAGDVRWQGRVQVRGDVVIAAGAHLQIAPGTEVVFLPAGEHDRWTDHPHFPGSELIVHGTLSAVGTAAQPIIFRYQDATAPAGSWGGINLVESPEARFRYCRFVQADSALHSQQSTVFVEDSLFERNRVGIRFHASQLLAERNLLRHNDVAIRFHYGAPVLCRNDIRDNRKGLFITAHPSDYRIEANNFTGNREANVVLGEEVPEDVMMPGNWWGSVDAGMIEAGMFDGRRIDYLGRVRYTPPLAAPAVTGVGAWSR